MSHDGLSLEGRGALRPGLSTETTPAGTLKTNVVWIGQPIRRVLSSAEVARGGEATIHLRTPLPTPSSSLPRHSGEQPSVMPCLALLRVGFTELPQSPGELVVSYTTVSPLPAPALRPCRRSTFCGTFLRVTPSGRYPPPCSVEPGRSSSRLRGARLPGCPIQCTSLAACAPSRGRAPARRRRATGITAAARSA